VPPMTETAGLPLEPKHRQAPGQLRRYNIHTAAADESARCNGADQAVLKIEVLLRDGAPHTVMSLPDLTQKHINGRFVAVRSTGSTSAVGRGLTATRSNSLPVCRHQI
jgi:hypothetical protein